MYANMYPHIYIHLYNKKETSAVLSISNTCSNDLRNVIEFFFV